MKIRLEIPKARELPSQGRNADSISAGSATAHVCGGLFIDPASFYGLLVEEGCFYRVWMDPDKDDAEFVRFVGWTANNDGLILEDGNGGIYIATAEEVEVV